MGVCCAVYGCFSSQSEKKRNFYRFPTEELRCRQWIRAVRRPDLELKEVAALHSYRICDLHFVSSDHLKRKLKGNAIPTLNLPEPETIINNTKSTQTEYEFKCNYCRNEAPSTSAPTLNTISIQTDTFLPLDMSVKRKLPRQLSSKCKLLNKMKEYSSSEDNESQLSPTLKKTISVKNRLKCNNQGNRYDREYKMFAMILYGASPLAYRTLAETFHLPSERTLRRVNIDPDTKLTLNNDSVI